MFPSPDLSGFRSRAAIDALVHELSLLVDRPMRFMEVCGTHTMAVARYGLRSLFPPRFELVSGPGCPVCVTAQSHVDAMIRLARIPGVTIATFGDMVRVPGSSGSLAHAMAEGARVEIVYSPTDALHLAREVSPDPVVFLAVGFETTAPAVAATILEAERTGVENLLVHPAHKLMPPALDCIMSGGAAVNGLLCPGHVSAVIGAKAYAPLAEGQGLPCVIGGFEPADILLALTLLARQVREGRSEVENAYPRAVSWEGNKRAREVMEAVFRPEDTEWRGLGVISGSGLTLREGFRDRDARTRFGVHPVPVADPPGCVCGEVLKGVKTPTDCPLFASRCTPQSPVGPCMVSGEGACAAHYLTDGPCHA